MSEVTHRSVVSQVLEARSVSTPLIAIETPDPGATTSELVKAIEVTCQKAEAPVPPIFNWDAAGWLRAINSTALSVLEKLLEESGGDPSVTAHPTQTLSIIKNCPAGSLIIMSNLHRFWEGEHPDISVVQAVWNLRDIFKSSGRTLVMTMPHCSLPSELQHDVMVLTAELPSPTELKPIVMQMHDNANWSQPSDEELDVAVSALTGLAHQQAEQTVAMSIVHGRDKQKLNLETLRSQQRQQVEQTPGLSIYSGEETFNDLSGMDALLGFMRNVIQSKNKPRAFIFIDEIEKMLAGALGGGTDSSGTSQEQLGYLLQHMQDTDAKGIILVGVGGTGKSALAKSCGNEGGCWTVGLDLGAMKGSLVGETGALTRRAFKIADSLAQGSGFYVATCNQINAMPPELRRRFNYGTWYIDLPNREARTSMWNHYTTMFGVQNETNFNDDGWTGAEIRTCSMMASEMEITLAEASKYISPVSRSSWETVQTLRRLATGRFLCASKGDFYRQPEDDHRVEQLNRVDDGLIEQVGGRLMTMDES